MVFWVWFLAMVMLCLCLFISHEGLHQIPEGVTAVQNQDGSSGKTRRLATGLHHATQARAPNIE